MGRYDGLEIATVAMVDADGTNRPVRYYRRRFPPAPGPSRQPVLAHHEILPGDRLDLISHRYLGDPLAYWQIADANGALKPDQLVDPEQAGGLLVIVVPGIPS